MLADILPLLQTTVLSFFADDPMFRLMQGGLLIIGALDVFLLFWTLRDVLTRSESLPFQMCALLMVFAMPFVGFMLYLLVRPSSTIREQQVVAMVEKVLASYEKRIQQSRKNAVHSHKKPVPAV